MIDDGDNVVALVHIKAEGRASGVPVDLRFWAQFEVRDGMVIRVFDHRDRAGR